MRYDLANGKGAISKFFLEKRSKRYQGCSLEILNGIKSNWIPQSLHLRRNVSRRGASGWGGIVGRCRRVGSGGRILTVGSEGTNFPDRFTTIANCWAAIIAEASRQAAGRKMGAGGSSPPSLRKLTITHPLTPAFGSLAPSHSTPWSGAGIVSP